jgi:hypothetical protein
MIGRQVGPLALQAIHLHYRATAYSNSTVAESIEMEPASNGTAPAANPDDPTPIGVAPKF